MLFFFFWAITASAQDLSNLANEFLNSLTPQLESRTLFELDNEERYNMNFVPTRRKGPNFHDLNGAQKKAALALLKASLSQEGYRKSREIMELETVLFQIENNNPGRDALDYHFCIFGEPAGDSFWGWRFEGHHLSLNFTSDNNKIVSSTPSFMGTNPAIVNVQGFDRKQVLQQETELGFALVNSLDKTQLAIARFSENAPREIITGTQRKVKNIEPRGIYYSALTADQQKAFMKLLNVYIDNYELGYAEDLRAKIIAQGIDNLSFAWAGSLKPGKGHYYRIQGPTLLIEYDNIQNNANHVHSVVRDLTNDYAEDLLRKHYQKDH